MKIFYFVAALVFCGCAHGNADSKTKIVALRDALNAILDENEQVETRSEKACTFHACTAETLGCAELKQVRGCPVCECAEIDAAFGKTPHKQIGCPKTACSDETMHCGPKGVAKDERGCDTCRCAALEKQPRSSSGTVDKGSCMLIPEPGRCRAYHERYYFNRATMTCEMFIYGGCDGNANNFETREECSAACGLMNKLAAQEPNPVPCTYHACTPEILGCAAGSGLKTNYYGCPLCECEEEGNVVEQLVPCPMHACTAEMLQCEQGLAKNENGCDLCECATIDLHQRASSGSVDKGSCMLIPEPGRCRAYHERYYFNRATMTCEMFIYGGCDGNANNFETREECSAACGLINKLAAQEPNPVPCTYHACTPEILGCAAGSGLKTNYYGCPLCECEVEGNVVVEPPVPCPAHSCSAEMLQCQQGLAKNENGCDLCECAMVDVQLRASSGSVDKGSCMLLPEQGRCRGRHVRYYYNRAAAACEKFLYGGCDGNANNFETWEECSAACGLKSKLAAQEPQPAPCLLHGCTPEILGCAAGSGLKTNYYGCTLCECEEEGNVVVENPLPCPKHACTAEMLECEQGLAKNDNGCDLCECAVGGGEEVLIPCPYHACTAENMGCSNGLAQNENGCDLCECATGPAPVGCPYHACDAEMMGCTMGLAKDQNGCDLCECAEENGAEWEEEQEPVELSQCEQQRRDAEELEGQVQDGPFKPRCNEDGSYTPQQCYMVDCWCVETVTGKEIPGTRVSNVYMETMTCHSSQGPEPPKPPPKEPPQRHLVMREAQVRREVQKALRNVLNH